MATTETASSTLKPNPMPAQSSVGNSPSHKKPGSKFAVIGAEMKCGSAASACAFHQPANGNSGGVKLSSSNSSALPQTPTTGFFMAIPMRSMDSPDQSPR